MKGSILTLPQRAREVARRVMAEVLTSGARRIVSGAKTRWPVDSGRSRRLLSDSVATSGARTTARIVDGSGYGTEIVSGGVRPWESYVSDPARVLVERTGPAAVVRGVLAGLRVTRG